MSTPLEVIQKNEEKFEDSMSLVQADKLLHPREYIRTINNDNTLTLLQALHDELEGKKEPAPPQNYVEAVGMILTDLEIGSNQAIQDQQDNLQALKDKIQV